jgi:hypothetical protein
MRIYTPTAFAMRSACARERWGGDSLRFIGAAIAKKIDAHAKVVNKRHFAIGGAHRDASHSVRVGDFSPMCAAAGSKHKQVTERGYAETVQWSALPG